MNAITRENDVEFCDDFCTITVNFERLHFTRQCDRKYENFYTSFVGNLSLFPAVKEF